MLHHGISYCRTMHREEEGILLPKDRLYSMQGSACKHQCSVGGQAGRAVSVAPFV